MVEMAKIASNHFILGFPLIGSIRLKSGCMMEKIIFNKMSAKVLRYYGMHMRLRKTEEYTKR